MLEILKIVAALFNVGFGLWVVLQPTVVAEASNFTLKDARGRAEMRIASGGFFIGMGIGAILFGSVLGNADEAYQVIGVAWVTAGVVRVANLMLESPAIADRSYWFLLLSELIPGIILLLPQ